MQNAYVLKMCLIESALFHIFIGKIIVLNTAYQPQKPMPMKPFLSKPAPFEPIPA